MGHKKPDAAEILNRLLEISRLQRRFAGEDRFEEAVKCQEERDSLFRELELTGSSVNDPVLKKLAGALVESDRKLSESVEEAMAGIGAKLAVVISGKNAVKAYGKSY